MINIFLTGALERVQYHTGVEMMNMQFIRILKITSPRRSRDADISIIMYR